MLARALVMILGCLVVIAAVPAPAAGAEGDAERYIVGYNEGGGSAATTTATLAGATVVKRNDDLRIAVVTTSDPARLQLAAATSPAIQYVERDDPTRIAGAQWNGAQWNGAQWNGAQWNGAQWNGAQWNGAQWNGAQWNGAQWNGAQWNGAQWNAAWWTARAYSADSGYQWHKGSADPGVVWQWGLWHMNVPHAWSTTMGTRAATICVLDSGVAWDHPDLDANVWRGPNGDRGRNVVNPSQSAYDDGGHGTHIAGIAAAVTGNAFGVAGVGNTMILPVKVLNSEGRGYESDLAIGIAHCANQDAEVAVMALSATEPGPTMDRALAFATAKDVLLMASAGNDGPCASCVAYPANDPRVVAVSAVDGNLTLAPFSARGAEVELAAPGVHVLSTFLDGQFVFGSGTSQAVAYAAGLAALVRDTNPGLSAEETRAALASGARDLGPAGRDASFGHGLVDAPQSIG